MLIWLEGSFGTTDIIEYLLSEGYQFILKLHSTSRSKKLGMALEENQWMYEYNGLRWARLLPETNSTLYTTKAELQTSHSLKLRLIAVRCKREEPKTGAKTTRKG